MTLIEQIAASSQATQEEQEKQAGLGRYSGFTGKGLEVARSRLANAGAGYAGARNAADMAAKRTTTARLRAGGDAALAAGALGVGAMGLKALLKKSPKDKFIAAFKNNRKAIIGGGAAAAGAGALAAYKKK